MSWEDLQECRRSWAHARNMARQIDWEQAYLKLKKAVHPDKNEKHDQEVFNEIFDQVKTNPPVNPHLGPDEIRGDKTISKHEQDEIWNQSIKYWCMEHKLCEDFTSSQIAIQDQARVA